MRSLWKITGLLGLILLTLQTAGALRLRGEQLPGVAGVNRHRTSDVNPSLASLARSGPEGRVTGGTAATAGSWPWIVTLQNVYGYHICGGVIIDKDWILTAASCVAGLRPRNVIVVTGTTDWWDLYAIYYIVDSIHVHCNFDQPLYHNDVALLHMADSIEFNENTTSITLADIDELQEGEKLTFAGWGSPTASGTYERYLQEASGTYVPVEQCRTELGGTEDVDLGHVCVQLAAGKGACHGDTGGPLIDEQNRLVGIGNWGVPCGLGYPDVYARTAFYHDWLRTTMNGCTIS
ncbi:GL27273 [Drosophila persimilis]|uniref:GL27273 n=1 Tax=Drosophila persimilis TaxID=7234 RepID=B4GYY7_DROPE|nr:chymotrypsin-2 [Drosophila persimilis]EDW28005.1 GL27273 [Drosophila persimilis]